MKRILGALGIGAVLGCGSEADPPATGDCAERMGTYVFTYVERDGTCGPFPEQVITIGSQAEAEADLEAAGCSGDTDTTANNCRVTSETTCPEPGVGPGVYSETSLVADWNTSGSRGTALMSITVREADDTVSCRSTYDVTVVKR